MEEHIVAVGLLTQRNLDRLGHDLSRIWPVEHAPSFNELLRAIDEADQKLDASRARKQEH